MVWPFISTNRQASRLGLVLANERLLLRSPQRQDFAAWRELRQKSRSFLQPWEPAWPADDLTQAAFNLRIKRYTLEIDRGEAYPFFIFAATDSALLGGLNLSNVRRGAASMATLGYWMGQAHAGQGIMSEAVQMIVPFAAERLNLRRLEAACLPENAASLRLLEKAQFLREGYAREYLMINGDWRDHILLGRSTTRSDPT